MIYGQLTSEYLLDLFPEFENEIYDQLSFLGEELPHCIYANILNPFLKKFFKFQDLNDVRLVERIFNFYEDLAINGDFETKCLLGGIAFRTIMGLQGKLSWRLTFYERRNKIIV